MSAPDDPTGLFIVVAAALAALGGGALAWWGRPAWPLAAAVVLTVFSGNWALLGLPVPLDRIALVIAVGLTLLAAARRRQALRTAPLHWLLALVALYALVSAVWFETLDATAMFGLLDRLGAVPFLAFFLAPIVLRDAADRGVFLGALVALGGYLGFTAVAEAWELGGLVQPGYINDSSIGIHADRARGPFLEAVANGLALYACGVAAAVGLKLWRKPVARGLAALVLALCTLGILFTLTRAVWLASVVATVIALSARAGTRRLLMPALVAGAVATVVALGTTPGLLDAVTERSGSERPVLDRLNSNAAGLRMVRAEPLFGVGWGGFAEASAPYFRQAASYPLTVVEDIHNVFLSHAVELGGVGALLWLAAFLLAIVVPALRRGPPEVEPWRVGLLAIAVHWIVVASFGPLGYAMPTLLLWTWAGLVWGAQRGRAPAPVRSSGASSRTAGAAAP